MMDYRRCALCVYSVVVGITPVKCLAIKTWVFLHMLWGKGKLKDNSASVCSNFVSNYRYNTKRGHVATDQFACVGIEEFHGETCGGVAVSSEEDGFESDRTRLTLGGENI